MWAKGILVLCTAQWMGIHCIIILCTEFYLLLSITQLTDGQVSLLCTHAPIPPICKIRYVQSVQLLAVQQNMPHECTQFKIIVLTTNQISHFQSKVSQQAMPPNQRSWQNKCVWRERTLFANLVTYSAITTNYKSAAALSIHSLLISPIFFICNDVADQLISQLPDHQLVLANHSSLKKSKYFMSLYVLIFNRELHAQQTP